ncbi:histidine ammonia-lyase [Paragonimus westermani]|uniref:Histidine ammonia-lyase n=1 Tax=Paragonimus westermani TaxID=34504 RepID=A0A5J4NH48_9TREM|nr:histidine ammonia-lyase [Paragonimus westermani]
MHINVKVLSDYLVVTVDENRTIQWLADEAITKYRKGFSGLAGDLYKDTEQVGNHGKIEENLSFGRVTAVRRRRDYAMLCSTDIVGEVLRNEEYVIIEFETHKIPFWMNQGIHNADLDSGFNLHLDETAYLELDGDSLTPEDLVALGKGQYRIRLSKRATKRVSEARKVIDNIVSTNKVTYGVNTGFGMFASTVIDSLKLNHMPPMGARAWNCWSIR